MSKYKYNKKRMPGSEKLLCASMILFTTFVFRTLPNLAPANLQENVNVQNQMLLSSWQPTGFTTSDIAPSVQPYLEKPVEEEVTISPTFIDATSVKLLDLRTPSGLTAEQLAYGLKKGLIEKAERIIQCEQESGINAYFIAAVAALESGWAEDAWAVANNNYFGYGYYKYDSFDAGITSWAKSMTNSYLTEGGKYHHGYTVEAVRTCYNKEDPEWKNKIESIMVQISNRVAEAIQ